MNRKTNSFFIVCALVLFCLCNSSLAQDNPEVYKDKKHFSNAFKKEKTYRIYFPIGYENSKKNYPVIYYFHGWGGRYYKDDNALLEYNMIGKLVDKYQVILIMWDGNMEESEPRPYNIGYHQHMNYQVQMKDYFLELVSHVDSTYRTKTERNSRAIIGYSMGGIMSFFLAGKYPHLISSAANLTGSPEFYFGYPNNHTLYPLRYTFENLRDVRIRLHNSATGELSALNREVNKGAEWDGNLTYEYWEFEGGHKVDDPGETAVFEKAMKFVTKGFKNFQSRKKQWSHYDLYANFEVWDYHVMSDKETPGFIYLKDITSNGFGFYTKEWLPNGPSLNFSTKIITAPIYEPHESYQILDFNKWYKSLEKSVQKADSAGRLSVEFTESEHEIGIYKAGESPIVRVSDFRINENEKMLRVGQDNAITLNMINVGELPKENMEIKLSISSSDDKVLIPDSILTFALSKERIYETIPVQIDCSKLPTNDGRPPEVRLHVNIMYDSIVLEQELVIPVFFEVPAFDSLKIDDGTPVKETTFGLGNGDGMLSPGEEIMVYQGDHRLQLFYDDQYITSERLSDETLPGKWTDDGTTLSSIIKVSENCPVGYQFVLLGKYETKTHMPMFREVHWGKVILEVTKAPR